MSRRLSTSTLAGILVLLFAGATLAPFLAVPATAFGEHPFESNTVISGTSHLKVYFLDSVAQSFAPTLSYHLFNVTLRLRNEVDTTDTITVGIRTDAGGVPSNVVLASAQLVLGNNNLGNYNVVFPVPANLVAGSQYWIVATCPSSLFNAYEWHHSGADTYPAGRPKVNQNLGGGWVDPTENTDLYFVTYGRGTDVNVTGAIVTNQPGANPGDLVTFRVFLNNSGDLPAATAWVNDSQLPGFEYVSDTASAAGSTTGWPSFTFTNVLNGIRSFNITARVVIGTEPGTVIAKALTTAYVDGSGNAKTAPGTQGSILVGMRAKQIYLDPARVGPTERLDPARPTGSTGAQVNETLRADGSAHDFDLDPVLSRSFRATSAIATLYLDSIGHDIRDLDLNLSLTDWNGVTLVPVAYLTKTVTTNGFRDYQPFSFAFPSFDHAFPSGGRIRFSVTNLAKSGNDAVLAMNSTFAASRLDLNTTTYVRIDLIDLRDASISTTTWSPRDVLVVQANVSDPLGSAEIAGARINLTSPSGALLVNFTAMALLATDPSNPSAWKLFRFTFAPPLSEGTYRVSITATESNGVHDIGEAVALVRAPRFTLVKTATASNVGGGDRFTYDVWFNNTGTGPAGHVWLNDSLPSDLSFLGSSDPAAMTGNFNWTWTSLGLGNYRLSIDVVVATGLPTVPYARNFVFLNYADEKGFGWPMKIAYADVAFRGPVIALATTSTKAALHSNEPITYQISMQNTGDPAGTLWLNDTLPAGLTYVSDTAATLGGTSVISGNIVYVQFADMPALSTWSFSLTAVADPNLVRGSLLHNRALLNYTNANGFLLPPREASSVVPVNAPSIESAYVTIVGNRATPADVIRAVVTYANEGNEPARDMWVNLTVDNALNFLNATLPAFVSGNEVRFTLANVPVGLGSIVLNASMDASVEDHQLLAIGGTISFTDGYRNRLLSVPIASDGVEASSPKIRLFVTPGNTAVEAAGLAFFTINQVNAGSGVAGNVWLTLPLPPSFVYVNDLSDGERTLAGATYTWHWSGVAPGAKSFSLQLRAKPSVLDGTRTNLTFHTDYTDTNGNFRPGNTTYAVVNFVAPRIDMGVSAASAVVRPGETVALKVNVTNVGGSEAHNLWLTTELNPDFTFVYANARVPATGTTRLNWSFTDIQPSQSVEVTLFLRVVDGTATRTLISAAFDASWTNSGDAVIGFVHVATAVEVGPDPMPLVWIGISAVALGLLAATVIQRQLRVQIEEVFLVYRDGVLIYHLSRSLSQDKDEDVLSGMLTAIQEFVRDAFVYGEHRELHQLDFGDYRIMIERGRMLYLAVVYSGKASSVVRKRVRSVLDHIETAYRAVLEKWDGDMDKVAGARDLIREYLLKPNGRHRLKGMPGLP